MKNCRLVSDQLALSAVCRVQLGPSQQRAQPFHDSASGSHPLGRQYIALQAIEDCERRTRRVGVGRSGGFGERAKSSSAFS